MPLLEPRFWPLWLGWLFLAVIGVYCAFTVRVPNWLSIGSTVCAWLLGACFLFERPSPASHGTLPASVFCAFLSGIIFMFPYSAGRMGAGIVKAQISYGAWLGCALPYRGALALTFATSLGAMAILTLHYEIVKQILWRKQERAGPGASPPGYMPLLNITPLLCVVDMLITLGVAYFLKL